MVKVATTGLTVSSVPYGESVVAGDLVGWSDGKLVRACGAAGAVVQAAGVAAASYKSGDKGAMHLMGEIAGFSGLTPGATQYLSISTPGGVQSATPSGSGNLKQIVGYAVAADRVAIVLRDAGTTL